jgi:putative ABC transport system permease protein
MSAFMRGNARMAIAGVRGAKWRSFLTMLGVIIGIVSVVTVVGIGEGMKHQVAGAMGNFGNDLITVRPGQVASEGSQLLGASTGAAFGLQHFSGFSTEDIQTIQKIPAVGLAAPLGVVPGTVSAGSQQLHGGMVLATGADLPRVMNHKVAYGAFWEPSDENANYAALGSKAAVELFGDPVPLGKRFMFRGEEFMVRAVFDDFANVPLSPTAGFDNAVFIPYQTAARITGDRSEAYTVLAKPGDPNRVDVATFAITEELKRLRGGEQDFNVLGAEDQIASSNDMLDLLSTWILAVAAISLLIGGVGIMNIMLVSVTERMHEIGVRKAIGATNRQIMWQFLLEAVALSVVGGVIGIVLSLLAHVSLLAYTDLQPVLSWQAIAIATGISLAVGIVFGTAPAIKAARKDPIEALRHE